MTVALESRMARRTSHAEKPAGILYWQPSLGVSENLMVSERIGRMEGVVKAAKRFNHAPLRNICANPFLSETNTKRCICRG